jgi:hypothetical protein
MENTNVNPSITEAEIKDTTSPAGIEAPKKKAPIALLLILGLVVLIAAPVLYFTLNQPIKEVESPTLAALPTPVPFFLDLENPAAEAVSVEGQVLVSGKTFANTTIAVITEDDELILESDELGNFEGTIMIGDEGGLLTITAYSEEGEEISKTFMVSASDTTSLQTTDLVMAAAEIMAKNENQPSGARPVKANSTKERIQTNPAEKQIKVKAFLEVKTATRQAAKAEKIEVKALKEIMAKTRMDKDATMAANLKIKKMATQEATAGAVLKRHAVSGVITAISDGMITVSHQIQRDRSTEVYFNPATIISMKDTETASASSFTVGMRVTAVGEPVTDGLLAKRIHVIPGKATGLFEKNPVASKSADPDDDKDATDSGTASPSATPAVTASLTPSNTPTPATPTVTESSTPSPTIEP